MSIKPNWNEITLSIGEDLSHDELQSKWPIECHEWLESVASKFSED